VLAAGALATITILVAAILTATSLSKTGATAETPSARTSGPELFLESAATAGHDPFTDSVSVGEQPLPGQQAAGSGGDANPQLRGDNPGLYGGTRDNTSCDPAQLVAFLQANPDKGNAWASALTIQPTQIAAYVAVLTPVVLRADTRVTNHGYRTGVANALQSTLQAGSAVLIDQTGVPRVRCACGNPLAEPEPIPAGATYSGAAWNGFNTKTSVAVAPGAPVDRFTLIDIDIGTGLPFKRPVGTDGSADAPASDPTVPPPARTTAHGHGTPTTPRVLPPLTTPPVVVKPPKITTEPNEGTPPPDSPPEPPPNCAYDGDTLYCKTTAANGGGGGGGGGGDD
jgi:hypothetical protein